MLGRRIGVGAEVAHAFELHGLSHGNLAQRRFQIARDPDHRLGVEVTPGVLSMARSMMPDSAGSQFFIMHANAPHLDGDYAAFGKLTEGEDVLDKIATCDTDWNDRPLQPQVMKTVTVETFDVDYDEPETL